MSSATIKRARRAIEQIDCTLDDHVQIQDLLKQAISFICEGNPHDAAISHQRATRLYYRRGRVTTLLCIEALCETTDALIHADRDVARTMMSLESQ